MTIDLCTGYACNQRCRFCSQGDRREGWVELGFDAVAKMMVDNPGEGIVLAGGEITLRSDLPRLIGLARTLGFRRVGIQTNGRVLGAPGAARTLRDAGLTHAFVALHGAEPSLHEWLTDTPGGFRDTVRGARALTVAGVDTRIATVVTRSNGDSLPGLTRLVAALGARGHRMMLATPRGGADAEERMLVPRYSMVKAPLAEAVALARAAGIEPEVTGLPLCFLPGQSAAVGDRADAPTVRRVGPVPSEPVVRTQGPPCEACPLRGVCRGPTARYVARWGWAEMRAES